MSFIDKLVTKFQIGKVPSADHPSQLEREEVNEHYGTEEEGDLMVLDRLRRSGADLSKSRHILHYLYFNEVEDRERAARAMNQREYEMYYGTSSQGMKYYMTVERHGIIDEQTIAAERPMLTNIAEANGGRYDGWEAQQG